MFSKEAKKRLTTKFWSNFDVFCNSVPELNGLKKRWSLHDTKISHVDLEFDVGRDFVMVAIEINHRNSEHRLQVYELLERYRPMLENGFADGLIWDFCYIRENGQEVCRIYQELKGADFLKITDWLLIYDFLAKNMLLLQNNFMEIQEYLADEILAIIRDEI